MLVAAPKMPVTGFQAVEVKKFMIPNFPIAREDSLTRTTRIPMMKMMTVSDATAVRKEKNRS